MEAKVTDNLYHYEEEFRDTIATVDEKGKRVWVYPKKPAGRYHRARIGVTVVLLAILFGGPFIHIKGQPLLLLNFFDRKFVVLGQVFWPQDFVLLALTLITFFVIIILFTVVFGRVWCGWACPQTLFMEMVFRKIEYWIEGDANDQRKLNNKPWTAQKILKKTAKQFIFLLISLLISHTVMAYLIGIDETMAVITSSPVNNWPGFIGLMGFTAVFYWVYARFREQACVAVCPYGRLQGVLLAKNSIVVAYDWLRGEPRGKLRKHQPAEVKHGDCIDCKLCIHVCPTGIDIRHGTQLECVNCTACIDACDDVMIKIGKPKGLIRFASFDSIKNDAQKLITGRVIAYSFVLVALVGLLSFMLFTRSEIETTVLRAPGTLYQKTEDGLIVNIFHIEFLNKTFNDLSLEVRLEEPANAILQRVGDENVIVPAENRLKGIYFIKVPERVVTRSSIDIVVGVYHNGEQIQRVKTKFVGPVKMKKVDVQ